LGLRDGLDIISKRLHLGLDGGLMIIKLILHSPSIITDNCK